MKAKIRWWQLVCITVKAHERVNNHYQFQMLSCYIISFISLIFFFSIKEINVSPDDCSLLVISSIELVACENPGITPLKSFDRLTPSLRKKVKLFFTEIDFGNKKPDSQIAVSSMHMPDYDWGGSDQDLS